MGTFKVNGDISATGTISAFSFLGNAATASLLSIHNTVTSTSTRSVAASSWNGSVSGLKYVWGEAFKDTSIGSDTGDLVLGLRAGQYASGSTELCMMIDGDYYSMGNKVLHAGNYNNYVPTKTGTGASGTWGINITGSARYADGSNYAYRLNNRGILDNITTAATTGSMVYDYNVHSDTPGLFPVWNNANAILTLNKHGGNYDSQLGFSSDGRLYYRGFNGYALDATTGWNTIAWTSDLSNYARLEESNNMVHAGNEWTVVPSGYSGALWLNYRTCGGTNGNITDYYFGNGKGGTGGVSLIADSFTGNAASASSAPWSGITGKPGGLSSMTLLWQNASPSSSFGPQTISLAWSGFHLLVIYFAQTNKSSGTSLIIPAEVGWSGSTSFTSSDSSTNWYIYGIDRYIRIESTNTLYIGEGASRSTYGTIGNQNDRLVPIKIYGIRIN